jgi:hypothetical protein
MVYHSVHLGPSEYQLHDLAKGEAVLLSPHHFEGKVEIFLTTLQKNRIMHAKSLGKSCKLKLSPAQIKYCSIHLKGGGIFTDLLKAGWQIAAPYLKETGMKLARKGLDAAINFASAKGKDYVSKRFSGKGVSCMKCPHCSHQLGKGVFDDIGKLLGMGMRPAPRIMCPKCSEQLGEGFFSDMGKLLGRTVISGALGGIGGMVPIPGLNLITGAAGSYGGNKLADLAGLGLLGRGDTPMDHHTSMRELQDALGLKKKARIGQGLYL